MKINSTKANNMMKTKKRFESPRVLSELMLQTEGFFLASVVDTEITLESTGQKVENHDFSESEFNHEWTSE